MRTSFQALLFSISLHLAAFLGFWGYLTYSEYTEQLEQEKQGWVPVGEVHYGFEYIGPFDNNLALGLSILLSFTLLTTALLFAIFKVLFRKLLSKTGKSN